MTTSGTVSYNQTRDQIIYDSLVNLNVIAPGETVDAADSQIAVAMFNKMIKAWEAQGIHLWCNTRATLFLQKNQEKYVLNVDGDNATDSFVAEIVPFKFVAGRNIIPPSVGPYIDGDYIGFYLQTGYRFWTTIAGVGTGGEIQLTTPLPDDVNQGTTYFIYTKKIFRPLLVNNAQRAYGPTSQNDLYAFQEVPIEWTAREDYFNLPNKRNPGTVTQYYYDPQLNNGYLYVWSMPQLATDLINFNYSRPLEDVSSANDTVDFPQEWLLAITAYLSYLLGPSYEKDANQISVLKAQADTLLALALSFDDEAGSIYITPNYRGMP